jgi:hypothetical protein
LTAQLESASPTKGRNLSQADIKFRILIYLFKKGQDGANANNIQSQSVRTSQDASRFRSFLDDLCRLKRIEKKDRSDLHKGLITYNITQKGRDTVQALRNELIKDILFPNDEETI